MSTTSPNRKVNKTKYRTVSKYSIKFIICLDAKDNKRELYFGSKLIAMVLKFLCILIIVVFVNKIVAGNVSTI